MNGDYLVVVKCFAGDSSTDLVASFRLRNQTIANDLAKWLNLEQGYSAKVFYDPEPL